MNFRALMAVGFLAAAMLLTGCAGTYYSSDYDYGYGPHRYDNGSYPYDYDHGYHGYDYYHRYDNGYPR